MRTHLLAASCVLLWLVSSAVGQDTPPLPVAPSLPVPSIKITDGYGKPVDPQDRVETGTLLLVSGEDAIHGNVDGSIGYDIEPTTLQVIRDPKQPDRLILLTPKTPGEIRIFQGVAKDSRFAFLKLRIQVGNGPQPPPPDPDDGDSDTDPPVVTTQPLKLSVVHNPRQIKPDTASVLTALSAWNDLKLKGNDWVFFSENTPEVKGKKAIDAMKRKGVPPPALVIDSLKTGDNIAVVPLPKSIDELNKLVKKYGGAP